MSHGASRPAACGDGANENRESETSTVLEHIEGPVSEARVVLSSGRVYELEAGKDADRLVVRSRGDEVVLRIEITDDGPVLAFRGATIALEASRAIELDAKTIRLRSRDAMELESGGDMTHRAGGHQHIAAGGDARVEGSKVEVQAGRGSVELLAEGHVAIDGEHIGLNDKPQPRPFPWSREANED